MAESRLNINVDWEQYLAGHDLVWDRMPEAWDEGPFLGNGLMGAMIYRQPGTNAVRIEVCRSDVQDHRDDTFGMVGFSRPRLPIGCFLLQLKGTISGCSIRLDLWNAEVRGRIVTDLGYVDFTSIVHSEEMVIWTRIQPRYGETGCSFQWHAADAVSPRQAYGLKHNDPQRTLAEYMANPPYEIREAGEIGLCVQPLLAGGETATAWHESETAEGRTLLIHTTHSWPERTASEDALAAMKRLVAADREEMLRTHREWWHRYYPSSFVSIPDTRLESFYWIQMYKLASATRGSRALIDNCGPWLAETPWPFATWNLNVQLTYWPLFASNRLPLAESLWRTIERLQPNLIANVDGPYRQDSAGIGTHAGAGDLLAKVDAPGSRISGFLEAGNLTWALHDCWLYYRMSMDDGYLRSFLYPNLRRSIQFYLHFLEEGEDGKLHLPGTSSPEYGVVVEDCNYDLALLRWGCETLLYCCDRLGMQDNESTRWIDVIKRLADYPGCETEGYWIGKNQRYEKSHRHYSHLLMAYPLYLVNKEQPGGEDRIDASLRHWQSKPEYLEGYSCSGAASIAAALGRGSEALAYLKKLWSGGFLRPNTMYKELGPVIETPLSAAQAVHDMLLQSWGDTIRVFPAVPEEWREATFHGMLAEGGFEVSAVRRDRATQLISIRSLAGERCRLKTDMKAPFRMNDAKLSQVKQLDSGLYELDLKRGEEIVLIAQDAIEAALVIEPCVHEVQWENSYGLNSKSLATQERLKNPEL